MADSNSGSTPLFVCVHDVDAIRLLIKAGAKVNFKAKNGDTPLFRTADRTDKISEMIAVATLLLDSGADLEARNNAGETPFLVAVQSFRKSAGWEDERMRIDFLLRRGANAKAIRNDGNGALAILSEKDVVGYRYLQAPDPSFVREPETWLHVSGAPVLSGNSAVL